MSEPSSKPPISCPHCGAVEQYRKARQLYEEGFSTSQTLSKHHDARAWELSIHDRHTQSKTHSQSYTSQKFAPPVRPSLGLPIGCGFIFCLALAGFIWWATQVVIVAVCLVAFAFYLLIAGRKSEKEKQAALEQHRSDLYYFENYDKAWGCLRCGEISYQGVSTPPPGKPSPPPLPPTGKPPTFEL